MASPDQLLIRYYVDQARNGQTSFYSGPIYQKGGQRGNGIGSFLSGLFRHILPVLRKGTVAIGKEIINSGTNFAKDLGNNVNARTALKKRSAEALANLGKKAMFGDGYKKVTAARKRQCSSSSQSGNSKKRKITKKKAPAKKKPAKKKNKKPTKKLRDIFCN